MNGATERKCWLFSHVNRELRPIVYLLCDTAQGALAHYRRALGTSTAYHGRTPLHVAALRYGQDSDMFKYISTGERLANGGSDERLRTLLDDEGIPPLGYNGKHTASSKVFPIGCDVSSFCMKTCN